MEVIRSFIAISLPNKVRDHLGMVIHSLKPQYPAQSVRWVAADNIHLTLMFLGDVPVSRLALLKENLINELTLKPEFDLQLNGLGVFPSLRKPRVLWIGLNYPAELKKIQDGIQSRFGDLGFPREDRPFSPHLTIGRLQRHLSEQEIQKIVTLVKNSGLKSSEPFLVEGINLYRSDLKPDGAVYSVIHSVKLSSRKTT